MRCGRLQITPLFRVVDRPQSPNKVGFVLFSKRATVRPTLLMAAWTGREWVVVVEKVTYFYPNLRAVCANIPRLCVEKREAQAAQDRRYG